MMAVIRFIDGHQEQFDPEVATELWLVLNGEVEGSEVQQAIAATIENVILNWHSEYTPDSYIEAKFDMIAPVAISRWMLKPARASSMGGQVIGWEPSRPEPSDHFGQAFAEKWGLTVNGKPTELARSFF